MNPRLAQHRRLHLSLENEVRVDGYSIRFIESVTAKNETWRLRKSKAELTTRPVYIYDLRKSCHRYDSSVVGKVSTLDCFSLVLEPSIFRRCWDYRSVSCYPLGWCVLPLQCRLQGDDISTIPIKTRASW